MALGCLGRKEGSGYMTQGCGLDLSCSLINYVGEEMNSVFKNLHKIK